MAWLLLLALYHTITEICPHHLVVSAKKLGCLKT
jgi:hypothetical protein